MKALRDSNLARQLCDHTVPYYRGRAVVLGNDPEKIDSARDATELHLMADLQPYLENLQKELIILSPYSVSGHDGVAYLRKLGSDEHFDVFTKFSPSTPGGR